MQTTAKIGMRIVVAVVNMEGSGVGTDGTVKTTTVTKDRSMEPARMAMAMTMTTTSTIVAPSL